MFNKILLILSITLLFCKIASAQTVIGTGQSAAIGCVQPPSTQTLIAVQPMSASTTFTIGCNTFKVSNNYNLLSNQTIKLGCVVTPPNIIGNDAAFVTMQSGQIATVNCTGVIPPTPTPLPSPVVVGPYHYNQFNSTNPNGNQMNNGFKINNPNSYSGGEELQLFNPNKGGVGSGGASIVLQAIGLNDINPYGFWDVFKYNGGAYFALGVNDTTGNNPTGITCDTIDDGYIYSGYCYTFGYNAGSLGFLIPQGRLGTPNITNVAGNGPPTFPFGLNLTKLSSAPATAPGAGLCTQFVVAGTNPGSCKLQMECGTSATPVTITDNIGSGC